MNNIQFHCTIMRQNYTLSDIIIAIVLLCLICITYVQIQSITIFIPHVIIFSINIEKTSIGCHIFMVLTKYTNNMRENNPNNFIIRIQWYCIRFLSSLGSHWNRKPLYWCLMQRQTDTYNNKATCSQPMYFCKIDVKIDEISIFRPSATWWYWNFFQSVMFGNESYASYFLSGSKRCTCDKDTEIDFVTL